MSSTESIVLIAMHLT